MISTNIKNTDHLFKALKINKNFLKASQKKFLEKNGYLLF